MGLGQIMPFNLRGLGIQNAWNPDENIRGCARMMRQLLNKFGSQPNGTLLAVAAYNAGPNAVVRAGYRVPNGSQVQGYVWKIYNRYKAFAPEMFQ
jgi:soluble lytic murein transglycosylase-like protein